MDAKLKPVSQKTRLKIEFLSIGQEGLGSSILCGKSQCRPWTWDWPLGTVSCWSCRRRRAWSHPGKQAKLIRRFSGNKVSISLIALPEKLSSKLTFSTCLQLPTLLLQEKLRKIFPVCFVVVVFFVFLYLPSIISPDLFLDALLAHFFKRLLSCGS